MEPTQVIERGVTTSSFVGDAYKLTREDAKTIVDMTETVANVFLIDRYPPLLSFTPPNTHRLPFSSRLPSPHLDHWSRAPSISTMSINRPTLEMPSVPNWQLSGAVGTTSERNLGDE